MTNGGLGAQGEGVKTRKSGVRQVEAMRWMEGTKAKAVWALMAAEDTSDASRPCAHTHFEHETPFTGTAVPI